MAHFADLSSYIYCPEDVRPFTKNVGWLAKAHPLAVAEMNDDLLDRLWRFCMVSVSATRGVHECELCGCYTATRHGKRLLLGTAEIRVFGAGDVVYAAPTLIFHYVAAHHYRPPAEFVEALASGPAPPDAEYFRRLSELGLAWQETSGAAGERFRFIENERGDVERVVVPEPDE